MRVMLVISSSASGGAERVVELLCRHLDPARIELSVVCPPSPAIERAAQERGVRYIPMAFPAWPYGPTVGRLATLIREERVDVLHTHLVLADVYGWLACRLARPPVWVSTVHGLNYLWNGGPPAERLRRRLIAPWYRAIYRACNGIATCSAAVKRIVSAGPGIVIDPGKIEVIHNGIDLEPFAPPDQNGRVARPTEAAPSTLPRKCRDAVAARPTVACISNFAPFKGHEVLIDALRRLGPGRAPRCVLVGDGPTRPQIEHAVRDAGLGGSVEFLGSRSDVPAILRDADLLVLPSHWEPFGLVILEAMAAGVPVVSTAAGGVPELITDGETGLLVPPGDSDAMAQAIQRLLGDAALRQRIAARAGELVRARFTADAMARDYEQWYLRLVAGGERSVSDMKSVRHFSPHEKCLTLSVVETRQATGDAETTAWPSRYLAYVAGSGTAQGVLMMQELVNRLGPCVESVVIVIGDLRSMRWARAQQASLDPRIQLVYQHADLNPFDRRIRVDYRRLAQWEARYGAPNLWRYILVHRMIDHLSDERKLAYVQTYLEYFESLYHAHRPQVLVTAMPDSMLFLMAARVMEANGAIPLLVGPGRFRGRIFIVDNDLERIPGLKDVYLRLKRSGVAPEQRQAAHALRDRYRAHRVRPRYYGIGPRLRALPSVRRFWTMWSEQRRDRDYYFERGAGRWIAQSLLTRWRTPWQAGDLRRHATAELRDEEPGFYYPLHYEPESAIDVFSTYYRDQRRVIKLAAEALPAGHVLYVKENPNMPIGTRPPGYYRDIARIPGVRLLPTSTDSYEILARCRGVVTLAGTTGFEALCCGKPVLLLGHAFYEVFHDGVSCPNNPEETARALQRMAAHPSIDDASIEAFLAAVLARTHAAEVEKDAPDVEGPDNIRALASSLMDELAFRLR